MEVSSSVGETPSLLSVRTHDSVLSNPLARLIFWLKGIVLSIFSSSHIVKGEVEMIEINIYLQHCCSVQIYRWVIADAISRVLESSAEKLQLWRKRLLASCIKSLIATYSNSKQQETQSEIETAMLSRLQKLLVSSDCFAPSPILEQSTDNIVA